MEEIDLIFAKPEIRDSALAAQMIHDRHVSITKNEVIEYEEKDYA